ncbi:PEP3 [Candida pseudojiufengensis]|uniref:PEP3 n=1 Tax=Candida pseudojiufengensis TaxID=497109 RepID=UPI002223F20C|nr:PEP3 [Candida pseudojiufengensis]KAI5963231.1 PEP3 [Candida pseudojiufengensis]
MNALSKQRKSSPSLNGSLNSSHYTTHSLDQHQISIYNNLQQPTFEIKLVQLQFQLSNDLQKLLVSNSLMYLFTSNLLYKIDLNNPSQVLKYNLPSNDVITNSWINSTGEHLIIKTKFIQYYYLNTKYKNFKALNKLKNFDIDHITFIPSTTLLLSTSSGVVYLCTLKPHIDDHNNKKSDILHLKQIHKFEPQIQGVLVSNTQINVIAQFKVYTWATFDLQYEELLKVFKTQPTVKDILHHSNTYLFTTRNDKFLFLSNEITTNDDEIFIHKLNDSLQDIIMTPHHLIGYTAENQIHIHNKLNQDLKTLPFENESIKGIVCDDNTYWIYTNNNIYELLIYNENSSVWYDYYLMNKFDEALNYLDDNEENFFKRDLVLIKQGYDYLTKGGFGIETTNKDLILLQEKGIKLLAKSTEPFEKVCLMLIRSNSTRLLIDYLLTKYMLNKKNRVRAVILSTWIIELMNRINDERFYEYTKKNFKHFDKKSIFGVLNKDEKALFYAELIEDYKFILDYHMENKNWELATKTLIKLYTNDELEEVYRTSSQFLLNYPKIIETWLKFDELDFDKFLPALLIYIDKNKNLSISKNYAVRFLQKVHDKGFKSKNLNNYYLSVLITYQTTEQDTINHLIIKFITNEKSYDQNFILRLCILNKKLHPAILIFIDMGLFEQALDHALKNNSVEMGEIVLNKYEEIIDEAKENHEEEVENDHFIKLEKDSYNIRRKLWLNFSKYMINNICSGEKIGIENLDNSKNKLNSSLNYILSNSPLSLKDLLPLFPETVMINEFKDEIINSLNDYKRNLQEINLRIQDNYGLLTNLKREVSKENTKDYESSITISPGSSCQLCKNLLITKNLIFFKNCGHGFHKECLIRYYFKSKGNYNFKKVYQQFLKLNKKSPTEETTNNNEHQQQVDLKNQIDEMLCKECVLCNESNINNVDVGFLDDYNFNVEEMKSWSL